MIYKSILTFLVLFLIYNLIITVVKPNIVFQNQWQLNRISAQEYLYSKTGNRYVVVGSSMSAFLNQKLLPVGTTNLAFGGQSPFDGFEIIKYKGDKPNVLLVELNTLFLDKTETFLKGLFMPGMSFLRGKIPALQERYQASVSLEIVLNSIKEYLFKALKKTASGNPADKEALEPDTQKTKITKQEPVKQPVQTVSSEVFEQMLQRVIEDYSGIPDQKQMEHQKQKLEEYKSYFNSQGIELIFFEMPMHEKLMLSKKSVYLRKWIQDIFPPNQYHYILPGAVHGYTTTDGIHLDEPSLNRYTKSLRQEILAYHSKKKISADVKRGMDSPL